MYSIGAVLDFMLCGEDHFDFDDGKKPSADLLPMLVTAARPRHACGLCSVSTVRSCSLFQDVSACCALYCLLHQP